MVASAASQDCVASLPPQAVSLPAPFDDNALPAWLADLLPVNPSQLAAAFPNCELAQGLAWLAALSQWQVEEGVERKLHIGGQLVRPVDRPARDVEMWPHRMVPGDEFKRHVHNLRAHPKVMERLIAAFERRDAQPLVDCLEDVRTAVRAPCPRFHRQQRRSCLFGIVWEGCAAGDGLH